MSVACWALRASVFPINVQMWKSRSSSHHIRHHASSIVAISALFCCDARTQQSQDDILEGLNQTDVQLDFNSYASLLRRCGKAKALLKGKLVHNHVIQNGFETNIFICNFLIQMYGDCGALEEALTLFAHLPFRDRFSWNFIIRVYVGHGYHKEALQVFESMQREAAIYDKFIVVNFLSACASIGASIEGKRMHTRIAGGEFETDVIVGTSLLNMYGKCGSLEDARDLFDRMYDHDTVSWNAMIAVYVQSARCEDALKLFDQMEQQGLVPDKATFVNTLSACASHGSLAEGKQLHTRIMENGLGSDVVVGTALVNMYAKCCTPENARRMFDQMHEHDVISWNAMIAAYIERGQTKDALQLFEGMLQKALIPDRVSFLCILETFSGQAVLSGGKKMHALIICSGFESDLVVGTSLVNMYGKCGSPEDARKMFDKMPERNVVSWNSIIAAYAQNGQSRNAFWLLENMQQEGLRPDKITLLSILDACASQEEVEKVHASIMDSLWESDDIVGSALINTYGKCGSLEDAWRIFLQSLKTNVALWNAMIAACTQNKDGMKAFQLFEQMLLQGMIPEKITFVNILDAYAGEADLAKGKRLHTYIVGSSLESDTVVGTALVSMYIKCSSLKDARILFDKLPERDVISWTALITGYSECGQCNEALELLENMQQEGVNPDEVTFVSILSSCVSQATLAQGKHIHGLIVKHGFESNTIVGNALLNMYSRCKCPGDALRMFNKIQVWDNITFASILCVCASWTALAEGKHIHGSIVCSEIEIDILVGNALVNMYGKCGSLEDARVMFDKMLQRDTITWTALIAAYAQHGLGKIAFQLFNKMQGDGVRPNEVTLVSVLTACSHDGLMDEGCHYFISMKRVHGITPVVDHFDCMIDLFGRAGRLDEAENVIRHMPFQGSIVSWTSLLGACRLLADVERGEYVAEKIFQLDPENPAPYVVLSNIYAAAVRGDDAAQMLMSERHAQIAV